MRSITFISVFVFTILLTSCNSTSYKESKNPEIKTASEAGAHSNVKVVHLTAAEFKEKVFDYENNTDWKYEGGVPCIIDFYADWCGPCKRIAPILDELAQEYDGKIIIYKIDTDKERELSAAFGIRSLPTILFVPMEGKPQAAQGALPKESFVKAIDEVLLNKGQSS